jgi:hypothetical protein
VFSILVITQRSTEKHREAQRSTEKHREAQRSTEKHRKKLIEDN